MSMQFTAGQEWFKGQQWAWERFVEPFFSQHKFCRALEIGSWEGGSAVWILQNLCGGNNPSNHLVCVDHFDLFETPEGRDRFKTFQNNIASTGLQDRVRVLTEFSVPALMLLMTEIVNRPNLGFDLVYIDASHRADDVLLDAEMAWRMANHGSMIVFDDYEWPQAPRGTIHHPKDGIDAFLRIHDGEYTLINQGYQIMIKKNVKQRLGFYFGAADTGAL